MDAAAVKEVHEFLAQPRRLETLCMLQISDTVARCPDREKKVAALPIPNVFHSYIPLEKQLEEFELAAKEGR